MPTTLPFTDLFLAKSLKPITNYFKSKLHQINSNFHLQKGSLAQKIEQGRHRQVECRVAKGQLISKCLFGTFNFSKKQILKA